MGNLEVSTLLSKAPSDRGEERPERGGGKEEGGEDNWE